MYYNEFTKVRIAQTVKWTTCIIIPCLIALIPLSELYTLNLRKFMMITAFILCLLAFELFETLIPAFMLPTLYFMSGIVPVEVAFSSWTNTTVWMVVGALVLANVLEECHLLSRVALWCIRKCGGSYTGTLYGLFITGIITSLMTFCMSYIVMITLAYGICKAMKLERSNESALICFVGMLGGITTLSFLYSPAYCALGEVGIRRVIPGFTVLWYKALMYNSLQIILFLGVIWLLTKVYKAHKVHFKGGKEYFDTEYKKLGPVTIQEKKAFVILILIMAFLLTTPYHQIPAAYAFMTLPFLMFLPGINVGSFESTRKLNFSIIMFIASCLGIGTVGDAVGATTLLSSIVTPVLQNASPLTALLAMMTVGVLANLVLTPYAMLAIFSMPFAQLGLQLGIDPMATIMTLIIATNMIFFPHEVSGCLIMYSFGFISMKNFIITNTIKTVLTYLFFICVMYPMWNFFGLVTSH